MGIEPILFDRLTRDNADELIVGAFVPRLTKFPIPLARRDHHH